MGQSRITVDDLGDLDAMLVTIDGARVQSFSNNYLRGGDEKVVLTFREFGDAEYVLNATSFHALCDRYGRPVNNADFSGWVGKPCVLVRTETEDPRTNAKIQSVWVAKPTQWAEAMRALEPEKKPAKPRKRASR